MKFKVVHEPHARGLREVKMNPEALYHPLRKRTGKYSERNFYDKWSEKTETRVDSTKCRHRCLKPDNHDIEFRSVKSMLAVYEDMGLPQGEDYKRNVSGPKATTETRRAFLCRVASELPAFCAALHSRRFNIFRTGTKGRGRNTIEGRMIAPPLSSSFDTYQDQIWAIYQRFQLPKSMGSRNGCEEIQKQSNNAAAGPRYLKLHKAQQFITNFFTFQNDVKGMMLLWDPGAGKTAAAVSCISASWERDGYTILWVTRNSLRRDLFKNIFDDIAHHRIKYLTKKGKLRYPIPEDDRADLLFNWMPVLTYRQFSNLCQGKNEYYHRLVERNGKDDFLRRTLIIIDEAHKLVGGNEDLLSNEKAEFQFIQKAVQHSYAVSGAHSVRLLLMTATPISREPTDFTKLANLLTPERELRLAETMPEFEKYFNANNEMTTDSVKLWKNALKGKISHYAKAKDPSQFGKVEESFVVVEFPGVPSSKTIGNQKKACEKATDTKMKNWRSQLRHCLREAKEMDSELQKEYQVMAIDRCNELKGKRRGDCLRQVENMAYYGRFDHMGSSKFDPDTFAKLLETAAPKIYALAQHIDELDARDMQKYGKTFKHAIYSGVSQGYGLRLVMTSLRVLLNLQPLQEKKNQSLVLKSSLADTKGKNAYLVLSRKTVVPGATQSGRAAKEVLRLFNARPENSHGQLARFLLFDHTYKEGVDLLDVRHKHFLEEIPTEADRVQAAGRSLRYCSLAGLPFGPSGWVQNSFMYKQILPPEIREQLNTKRDTLSEVAFDLMGIDERVGVLNELTLAYVREMAVDYDLNESLNFPMRV